MKPASVFGPTLGMLCLAAALYAPLPESDARSMPRQVANEEWQQRVRDWRQHAARIELSARLDPAQKRVAQQRLLEERFDEQERGYLPSLDALR